MGMIRVLIVAEVRFYREGLADALGRHGGIDIVGALETTEPLLGAPAPDPLDVILLDVSMPHALGDARALTALMPDVRIIGLGVANADQNVLACAEAGVCGFVRKGDSFGQLVEHIEDAARGELRCSPRIAATLLRRLAALASVADRHVPAPGDPHMTSRELQILDLVDQGLSNKEISSRLVIEVATVKNHIHHILEKLGARRRGEAAAIMRRERWGTRLPGRGDVRPRTSGSHARG